MMKIIFIFIAAICFAESKKLPPKPTEQMTPLSELHAVRVDPHGKSTDQKNSVQINKSKECLVCHTAGASQHVTSTVVIETCYNCHNKAPHSGVVEHAAHQINCISCHSFHRWDGVSTQKNTGIFSHLKNKNSTEGYINKSSQGNMIKKDCKECHTWK